MSVGLAAIRANPFWIPFLKASTQRPACCGDVSDESDSAAGGPRLTHSKGVGLYPSS